MTNKDDLYESAVSVLDQYIEQNRMRHTQERYTVLRQICQFPSQFTTEQLTVLRSAELSLSRATIYNAIQLFLDCGLLVAHSLRAGSKTTSYELVIPKRSQMIFQCTKCGREVKFDNKAIDRVIMEHKYPNFVPKNYSLYVFGECKHCRRPEH